MLRKILLIILSTCIISPVFSKDFCSLLLAGDTMLGTSKEVTESLFGDVLPELKNNYDFKFFNLEGTLGKKGIDDNFPKCRNGEHCYTFMSPVKVLDMFKTIQNNSTNQVVFNMANNHSMDYGMPVQYSTYKEIKQKNFGSIGSLYNPIEKYEKNGFKIAFIGASPHKNTVSIFKESLFNEIRLLKNEGYLIVVSLHMGAEGASAYRVNNQDEFFLGQNRGNIYQLSHKLIDFGADVIVGHGPHVMRGMEIYKNKLIAYSLGNFLTYGTFSLQGIMGYGGLLNVNIDKNGDFHSGKFVGTQQLKSVFPKKWASGIAIQQAIESMQWLKKISYENFPKTTVKIDDKGNLFK